MEISRVCVHAQAVYFIFGSGGGGGVRGNMGIGECEMWVSYGGEMVVEMDVCT